MARELRLKAEREKIDREKEKLARQQEELRNIFTRPTRDKQRIYYFFLCVLFTLKYVIWLIT